MEKINNLYARNRLKLIKKLKPNSVAIFKSNDIMPRNVDGEFPFCQNSDLYYLTGVNYPETTLIIHKTSNSKIEEILFIKYQDEKQKLWNNNIDINLVKDQSNVNNIYYSHEFISKFTEIAYSSEYIYLNLNEVTKESYLNNSQNFRFALWCKENFPLHKFERLAPIMKYLRMIKEPEEIDNLRQACHITQEAFKKALKVIKPGIYEYEIAAEFAYHFAKRGTEGFAFSPIIASGKNACILHYVENKTKLGAEDMVLIDVGVNSNQYNSDVSRTFPISGRFSKRQAKVYSSVLEVLKFAKTIIKSGVYFHEYLDEIHKKMESELIKLKLIRSKNDSEKKMEYKKYFMHGVSHHLGLDVHDARHNKEDKMQEYMVITVEPGIYIREESLGVRLENDVLIKKNGVEDFCDGTPIEIEEIEYLMK